MLIRMNDGKQVFLVVLSQFLPQLAYMASHEW